MKKALIIFACLIVLGLALPVDAAFDLSKGIVGNLPESCRLEGNCSFCDFIDLFVILQKVILSLFGGLALIMIVWGGTGIITAAGNSQKVAEAKKLIISTLFGVLIVLVGYFLISVLVAILVTPAGQAPKLELFGKDWTKAFCVPSSDPNFCNDKDDGRNCTYADSNGSGNGKCHSGSCLSACDYLVKTQPSVYVGCRDMCTTYQVLTNDYCPRGTGPVAPSCCKNP